MMEEKGLVPKRRFEGFEGEWNEACLGDNSTVLTGGTPNTNKRNYWYPKEIPWMSSGEINKQRVKHTNEKISREGLENSSARWIEKNSILIALAGQGKTRGKVAINNIRLTTNQSIAAIMPNESLYYEFVYQNLIKRYEELRLQSSGDGTRGGLNKQIIGGIKINFPSVEEQQKIGEFFKVLDERIANQERKTAKVKAVKEAYLTEMFPQEGETVPKRRFSGFEGEWVEEMFQDIVSKSVDNRGKTPPLNEGGKYSLIEVASLGDRNPNYSKVTKYINQLTYDVFLRDYIRENDILFSTVGRVGIVSLMDKNPYAVIAQNIVGFRAINNNCPNYLYALFSNVNSINKANRIVMGAVQPSIKVSQLIYVKYNLPKSYKEQQKIGNFFKNLDAQIAAEQAKLQKLKQMKEAYLEEMFV